MVTSRIKTEWKEASGGLLLADAPQPESPFWRPGGKSPILLNEVASRIRVWTRDGQPPAGLEVNGVSLIDADWQFVRADAESGAACYRAEITQEVFGALKGETGPEPSEPQTIEERAVVVDAATIQTAIGAHPRLTQMPRTGVDSQYRVLPRDAWDEVLGKTDTDAEQYVSEWYDCDDFAVSFKAEVAEKYGVNGVGIVLDYQMGHAYNAVFVVDDGGRVTAEMVEPQNDNWGVGPQDGDAHPGLVYI